MFLPTPAQGFSFSFSPASHEAATSRVGDIAIFYIFKLYVPLRQLMMKFPVGGYNDEAACGIQRSTAMNPEGINALLNYFGIWGVVFLIVAAICTIAMAVWLWRKI